MDIHITCPIFLHFGFYYETEEHGTIVASFLTQSCLSVFYFAYKWITVACDQFPIFWNPKYIKKRKQLKYTHETNAILHISKDSNLLPTGIYNG